MITGLKASFKRVGRLYSMLLDKHGNVIDGMHRLVADESWPRIRLENVETEEQRLITRLISNALFLTLKKLEGKERSRR